MRMNPWLRTGKCLAILLTLLIMTLKVDRCDRCA